MGTIDEDNTVPCRMKHNIKSKIRITVLNLKKTKKNPTAIIENTYFPSLPLSSLSFSPPLPFIRDFSKNFKLRFYLTHVVKSTETINVK